MVELKEVAGRLLPAEKYVGRCATFGVLVIAFSYVWIVLGSPVPQYVSYVEFGVGVGLTAGALLLAVPLLRQGKFDITLSVGLACTLYLTTIPLLVGFLRGNALADMPRDVLPLLFITALPLLVVSHNWGKRRESVRKTLVVSLLFVGLVGSAQFFWGVHKHYGGIASFVSASKASFGGGAVEISKGELASRIDSGAWRSQAAIYFKNYDPAALFTAVYLACYGLANLLLRRGRTLVSLGALTGGFVIVYGLMALGLRAYVGAFALAFLLFSAYLMFARSVSIKSAVAVGVFVALSVTCMRDVFELLLLKQMAVGANGKLAEFHGVLLAVLSRPYVSLFGIGWGGLFANPILLDLPTRFTHSLVSFYLLKGGFIGLGVLIVFLVSLWGRARGSGMFGSTDRFMIILACAAPLMIGVFFQPIYKMLSYGMVLTLLFLVIREGVEAEASSGVARIASPSDSASETAAY